MKDINEEAKSELREPVQTMHQSEHLQQFTDFHEIWCRHAFTDHPNVTGLV
jgi:hypothetical protein